MVNWNSCAQDARGSRAVSQVIVARGQEERRDKISRGWILLATAPSLASQASALTYLPFNMSQRFVDKEKEQNKLDKTSAGMLHMRTICHCLSLSWNTWKFRESNRSPEIKHCSVDVILHRFNFTSFGKKKSKIIFYGFVFFFCSTKVFWMAE